MNKTRNSLVALLLLVGSVVVTGCFEDNIVTYDGPLQVEFKPTSGEVEAGAGEIGLLVQLIGPQQSQPLTINFTVVGDATTAEDGVHYSLAGTSVTIPANSSSTEIPVNVLEPTTEGTLVLELQGSASPEVIPAENYKRFTLDILPAESPAATKTN